MGCIVKLPCICVICTQLRCMHYAQWVLWSAGAQQLNSRVLSLCGLNSTMDLNIKYYFIMYLLYGVISKGPKADLCETSLSTI